MRPHAILTWNVLHRVHAENWGEPAATRYADERARIAAIAAFVGARCVPGALLCLQEVSGDQLAAIRAHAPPGAVVLDHVSPRVPALRTASAGPLLDDPREHLVVIVCEEAASVVAARSFASDPGKGLLAVALGGGGAVLCTHLSFGQRRRVELREIAATVGARRGTVVVAGDFNATLDKVRPALGGDARYAELAGQPLRTRRGAGSSGTDADIDHVIVFHGEIDDATVLEDGGLSDHRPVTATVRFR